jgi:flagellar hook assembly protein FlgD
MISLANMSLSPLQTVLPQSQGGTATTPTSAPQSVEKNEFLKLLVTQLQNQDPLNPMNSDQFVTQLATFNSLEQLMSINQAVTKLADAPTDPKVTSTP